MLHIMPALLLGVAAEPASCAGARNLYEDLSLDRALEAAEAGLARGTERPLECLEVKGLSLLVLGRHDEARPTFEELFRRAPDHGVNDPSLSPALRATIEVIREAVRPLSAQVRARWLIHESLAVDVVLSGGLRGADRMRYRAELMPAGALQEGVTPLVGSTASATVAVPAGEVGQLRLTGAVLGAGLAPLHEFRTDVLLPPRPPAREPERVMVKDDGLWSSWVLWTSVGVAALGAAVAITVLAQPTLPDAGGTLGRVSVDP